MKIYPTGQIVFFVSKETLDVVYNGHAPDFVLNAELRYSDNTIRPQTVTLTLLHMEPAPFRELRAPRQSCPDVRAFDYFFVQMGIRHQWHINALIGEELVRIHYFEGLNGFATYTCLTAEEITSWYTTQLCIKKKEVII